MGGQHQSCRNNPFHGQVLFKHSAPSSKGLIFSGGPIVHFTVVCLIAKRLNRSEAKGDLVMIQILLLLKCKFFFVITLARYQSLSQQGHLQLHSKLKAWQLSKQLQKGLFSCYQNLKIRERRRGNAQQLLTRIMQFITINPWIQFVAKKLRK